MRDTINFLLYDWLGVESLCLRSRYTEHSRETFGAVLDTCERIAEERFAPFNRQVDTEEPRYEDEGVVLPQCAYDAARSYVESGMLAAAQDYERGGMQLPCVVEMAANAFFVKAGAGLGGGGMLTTANANLLMKYGSENQKNVFASREFAGHWFGTMCLSEPQAGSSISDIATRALPDGEGYADDPLGHRYRLFGNKMWISGGDHELAENIIHLVLAKIPDPDGRLVPGTKSISLFVVPKKMVGTDAQLTGERNDVALAGLNHKLGMRGLPNALLNFGEGRYPVNSAAGAIGYLVGVPGQGLQCMFHMMNEARIAVGMGAVAIGFAGYEASLNYAQNRRQGRPIGPEGKDASQTPARIIQHADVRRMLLTQKAYVEGGLALELFCARLVDEFRSGPKADSLEASALLEVLTPIAKSWPSEWCLEANNLAIQVHGGYGYTLDFPVEQYWRDNRLNMIHEGTHGIQALDLLGRKVRQHDGAALDLLEHRISATAKLAAAQPDLRVFAAALQSAYTRVREATVGAWETDNPEEALANATLYLQAFGHVVIAWVWLDVAVIASRKREECTAAEKPDYLRGKLQANRYFFEYELPKIEAWLGVVESRNRVCLEMQEEWFFS